MMKYTDNELKVILAKLQVGQLFLVKREELNTLYESIGNLLQAIQDTNYGIAKTITMEVQELVNQLLPTIEPVSDTAIPVEKNVIDTPVGPLDLENSPIGNLIKFNTLAEAHTRNSNKRKQRINKKNNS